VIGEPFVPARRETMPGVGKSHARRALRRKAHHGRIEEKLRRNRSAISTRNHGCGGQGFAVLQSGKVQSAASPHGSYWAFIHLQFWRLRVFRASVFLQWLWTYITNTAGSR